MWRNCSSRVESSGNKNCHIPSFSVLTLSAWEELLVLEDLKFLLTLEMFISGQESAAWLHGSAKRGRSAKRGVMNTIKKLLAACLLVGENKFWLDRRIPNICWNPHCKVSSLSTASITLCTALPSP